MMSCGVVRIEATGCAGETAIGSGFLVGPRLVLTVKHVVHGAGRIVVKRASQELASAAVIGQDAAIVSNCPIREVRRLWLHRISDHDGKAEGEGGIEAWLRLGEACGLTRAARSLSLRVTRHIADSALDFTGHIFCRAGNPILVHRGPSLFSAYPFAKPVSMLLRTYVP